MAKAGPNFTPHLLIDGTSRAALSGETFDLRHPATGAQIIDLMFELNRESQTTLVLVTHDESLSARCARVVRLLGGQVIA